MSTPPRANGGPKPVSRAAELAAEQVETIVAAAQASARQLADAAQKEVVSAREEAEQVRVLARQEARERIAEAQAAADEVLAEAKAVSAGMRQLAHLLETHAERILRDVTNSHRAISADLRAAVSSDEPPRATEPEREKSERPAPAPTRRPRHSGPRGVSAIDNPFDEIEPPSWVEEPGKR